MTIRVLHERGVSNRAIARQLGVDERTVRYRLRQAASGLPDGRQNKPMRAAAVASAIRWWMGQWSGEGLNLRLLYEWLVAEHDYAGSYKSVQG